MLVKVVAVALNYRDKMVTETGRGLPINFPFTPGSHLAGEVASWAKEAIAFPSGTAFFLPLPRLD